MFLGTLYMQQVLGFSALATGAAWVAASVTSLACAGLSQRIVTRTSPKLVMAFGMALIGAGTLWATQAPRRHLLARPGRAVLRRRHRHRVRLIPVSIGALAGVTERDAGVAAGLVNTSQNFGAAIGVAVASSIAASYSHTLVRHNATATALTGGFRGPCGCAD